MAVSDRPDDCFGITLTPVEWARMPFQERVADRMATLLFYADELLEMLGQDTACALTWLEPEIRCVYERVNDAMKRITD